jgi:hypothetical protein
MSTRPDCAEISVQLGDFVDDVVTGDVNTIIAEHLVLCPECAREVRALRRIRAILGDLPPIRLTPDRRAGILEEFKKTQSASRRPPFPSTRSGSDTPKPHPEQTASSRSADPSPSSATDDEV